VGVAVRGADRVVRRLESGDVGYHVPVAVRMNLDQRPLAEVPKRLDRRVERIRAEAVRDEEVASLNCEMVRAGGGVPAGRHVRGLPVCDDLLDAVPKPRDPPRRPVALGHPVREDGARRGSALPGLRDIEAPVIVDCKPSRIVQPGHHGCAYRRARAPASCKRAERDASEAEKHCELLHSSLPPSSWTGVIARRHAKLKSRATMASVATKPLQELLNEAFPDATELSVVDRTGGGDHFQVTVASPRFEGLSLVDQHRLVYDALAGPLGDGSIHELRIK